jgi:hypothetical protein
MKSVEDHPAAVNCCERIWFFPDKFWSATKNWPSDQISDLMQEVETHAAAGNVEALRKYPFVFVGNPYEKKKAAAAA